MKCRAFLTNYVFTKLSFKLNNSGDPYGIRTRDTAVKGRCLNHLTNGPNENMVAAEGIEPPTSRV